MDFSLLQEKLVCNDLQTLTYQYSMLIKGNTVVFPYESTYSYSEAGFKIANVSDIENIGINGEVAPIFFAQGGGRRWRAGFREMALDDSGDYVYVPTKTDSDNGYSEVLTYDISDRNNPTLTGTAPLFTSGAKGVNAGASYINATGEVSMINTSFSLLIGQTITVTGLLPASYNGTYTVSRTSLYRIYYIHTNDGAFTDANGFVSWSADNNPCGITCKGNYLYAAHQDALSPRSQKVGIFDISSPNAITQVGEVSSATLADTSNRIYGMEVIGSYLYMIDGAQLYIYNVADKSFPVLLSSTDLSAEGPYGFGASYNGNTFREGPGCIYLTDGWAQIWSLTGTVSPTITLENLGLWNDGIAVKGDLLLATISGGGEEGFEINGDNSLTLVGSAPIEWLTYSRHIGVLADSDTMVVAYNYSITGTETEFYLATIHFTGGTPPPVTSSWIPKITII